MDLFRSEIIFRSLSKSTPSVRAKSTLEIQLPICVPAQEYTSSEFFSSVPHEVFPCQDSIRFERRQFQGRQPRRRIKLPAVSTCKTSSASKNIPSVKIFQKKILNEIKIVEDFFNSESIRKLFFDLFQSQHHLPEQNQLLKFSFRYVHQLRNILRRNFFRQLLTKFFHVRIQFVSNIDNFRVDNRDAV